MSDLPPPSSNPPDVPPPAPINPIAPPASIDPVAPPEVPPMDAAPPPTPPVEPPSGDDPQPKDPSERTLGIVMHVIPLAGMILSAASIPFGHVIAPLIFWLIKKNESPYLDAHGKEVLNFQINLAAASVVGFILCFVCIGIPLLIALGVTALVLMVMAAIAVSDGKFYRYPWIYRIIK